MLSHAYASVCTSAKPSAPLALSQRHQSGVQPTCRRLKEATSTVGRPRMGNVSLRSRLAIGGAAGAGVAGAGVAEKCADEGAPGSAFAIRSRMKSAAVDAAAPRGRAFPKGAFT